MPPSAAPSNRSFGPRVRRALVLAIALAGLWANPMPLQAQEAGGAGQAETRETASMRNTVYRELARAQEETDRKRYDAALSILDKLGRQELNSYEKAQLWNLYGFIYYTQERYPTAIQAFETLLDQEDVPEAMETGTTLTLGQLYFATENWRKAIELVNRWISMGGRPQPQHYELLAQAHYQLGDHRNALAPARKAIELRRANGERTEENTLLLVQVLHDHLGQYAQAAEVLHELIKRFPRKQYWLQLFATYTKLEDGKKQLHTLELAYLQGFLDTETELLTLVGLLLQNDLPYRAGQILQKGLDDGVIESRFDHWRLLSQAWTLAQEDGKAIPALLRATALSDDGELHIVLAQSYMNLEQWDKAAAASREGLKKGGLARPDQAHLLLGQALFNMDAFDEARQAFSAAQADSRSRRLAGQWLGYVENEQKRRAELRQALQ